ncbi:MAG: hypothetical protein FJX77_03030 [Armatimonadetes bacterium]|nr:hypothetical protein [Armatimonadota bacterium]
MRKRLPRTRPIPLWPGRYPGRDPLPEEELRPPDYGGLTAALLHMPLVEYCPHCRRSYPTNWVRQIGEIERLLQEIPEE